MVLVKLVVRTPRKHAETLSTLLFEAGAGGIEERENGRELLVYAATREDAEGIAARTRLSLRSVLSGVQGISLKVEVDESSDWDTGWTKHLGQVALTSQLVIQPTWDETPVPEGARRIVYDPKLAFGDGAHLTTRLASSALERACRAFAGARVLDFGSGTGVLAFVAMMSGAAHVVGVDIDPTAIEAAKHNAQLNQLSGSTQFVLPDALAKQEFDVVVANLEMPQLVELAGEILQCARGAQRLILTGFLGPRVDEVLGAFRPMFDLRLRQIEEEWALLELSASQPAS